MASLPIAGVARLEPVRENEGLVRDLVAEVESGVSLAAPRVDRRLMVENAVGIEGQRKRCRI